MDASQMFSSKKSKENEWIPAKHAGADQKHGTRL